MMNVHGRWTSRSDDLSCIAWTREVFMATLPYSNGGAYANFLTAEETDRVKWAFGANYTRLAKIKRTYDPENFFRQNQNIRPE
nr:BBE domain-containing protein [Chthoniobacter flavus]